MPGAAVVALAAGIHAAAPAGMRPAAALVEVAAFAVVVELVVVAAWAALIAVDIRLAALPAGYRRDCQAFPGNFLASRTPRPHAVAEGLNPPGRTSMIVGTSLNGSWTRNRAMHEMTAANGEARPSAGLGAKRIIEHHDAAETISRGAGGAARSL